MSEEANLQIAREIYAAFKRKDAAAILDLQDEGAEWTVAGPADRIPWAAPGRGREGVGEFLKILSEWLTADQFEIRQILAEAETVVALGFQRGHVRPNGRSYEFDFVHVWRMQAGKVTSFRVYYDTAYLASRLHEAE
jgi:ketosteroid isomerase-like protein